MTNQFPEGQESEAHVDDSAPRANRHRTRNADIRASQGGDAQPRNLIAIARVSQDLKETIRRSPQWSQLRADQREALERIQEDVALILNGQADNAGAWDAIAEQAMAVADRVEKK